MNEQQVLERISGIVSRILSDKGEKSVPLQPGTQLLGGDIALDSLDLAMLVRELEEAFGFDPFQNGFIEFRTAGELSRLYVR